MLKFLKKKNKIIFLEIPLLLEKKLNRHFKDRLVVIDEIHNIRLSDEKKDKKKRIINQSLDIAKLSQNLLKVENLTSFIKRSLDFIK